MRTPIQADLTKLAEFITLYNNQRHIYWMQLYFEENPDVNDVRYTWSKDSEDDLFFKIEVSVDEEFSDDNDDSYTEEVIYAASRIYDRDTTEIYLENFGYFYLLEYDTVPSYETNGYFEITRWTVDRMVKKLESVESVEVKYAKQ